MVNQSVDARKMETSTFAFERARNRTREQSRAAAAVFEAEQELLEARTQVDIKNKYCADTQKRLVEAKAAVAAASAKAAAALKEVDRTQAVKAAVESCEEKARKSRHEAFNRVAVAERVLIAARKRLRMAEDDRHNPPQKPPALDQSLLIPWSTPIEAVTSPQDHEIETAIRSSVSMPVMNVLASKDDGSKQSADIPTMTDSSTSETKVSSASNRSPSGNLAVTRHATRSQSTRMTRNSSVTSTSSFIKAGLQEVPRTKRRKLPKTPSGSTMVSTLHMSSAEKGAKSVEDRTAVAELLSDKTDSESSQESLCELPEAREPTISKENELVLPNGPQVVEVTRFPQEGSWQIKRQVNKRKESTDNFGLSTVVSSPVFATPLSTILSTEVKKRITKSVASAPSISQRSAFSVSVSELVKKQSSFDLQSESMFNDTKNILVLEKSSGGLGRISLNHEKDSAVYVDTGIQPSPTYSDYFKDRSLPPAKPITSTPKIPKLVVASFSDEFGMLHHEGKWTNSIIIRHESEESAKPPEDAPVSHCDHYLRTTSEPEDKKTSVSPAERSSNLSLKFNLSKLVPPEPSKNSSDNTVASIRKSDEKLSCTERILQAEEGTSKDFLNARLKSKPRSQPRLPCVTRSRSASSRSGSSHAISTAIEANEDSMVTAPLLKQVKFSEFLQFARISPDIDSYPSEISESMQPRGSYQDELRADGVCTSPLVGNPGEEKTSASTTLRSPKNTWSPSCDGTDDTNYSCGITECNHSPDFACFSRSSSPTSMITTRTHQRKRFSESVSDNSFLKSSGIEPGVVAILKGIPEDKTDSNIPKVIGAKADDVTGLGDLKIRSKSSHTIKKKFDRFVLMKAYTASLSKTPVTRRSLLPGHRIKKTRSPDSKKDEVSTEPDQPEIRDEITAEKPAFVAAGVLHRTVDVPPSRQNVSSRHNDDDSPVGQAIQRRTETLHPRTILKEMPTKSKKPAKR